MTTEQKTQIFTLRAQGYGYVLSISSQWEKLTENTIKNF